MRQFMSKFFLPLFLFVIAISVILTGFSGSTLIGDGSEGLVVKSIELSPEDSGLTFIDQDRKGITVRMDIGTLDFVPVSTESGSFILPRIKGFSRNFNEGEPTLPVASKLIKIPFGCELDVTVLDSESETFQLSAHELTAPFMPVQPPLSKSQDPSTVAFEYNQDVYKKEKYSLPLASTEVLGTMRSTRLGRIAISPVEYYPTKNQITVYKSVTVRIIFKNPNWAWTNDMQEKYASCYFEPVNKQVLNFEPENSLNSDLVNYPVKYLIISDRMFESQLAPFIQWKTEKGFDVVVSYTDVIGTTTTAIQNYIEGLYNAGTVEDPAPSFVLLVGDVQQIPSFDGSSGSHITDLRYCEFTGDDYPEIYYGRFSAQTTAQLQPQIDKTLEYEQYTMPDPSYLADVTLVSGVDSTYAATHGNGQINYGTNYYFNAAHGINTNVWLYPDSNASGASAAIISTISNGVGFFNYTAHCSHTGPADPSFDQGDIASLTNAHKYLLGIGNCCLSNTFGSDYSTPSFGEAWMQAEDKGGIGWIGTSNNSYWDEDYWWGVGSGSIVAAGPDYDDVGIGAYDGIFHDHGEAEDLHYVTNGAIMYCGNMAVTEAGASRIQYYWEIYHLMGDPSIMAYMGLPSTNSVNHSSTVSPSATTFTVQAEAGSYVGLSLNGTLHGAGYIGSTGSASIPLTAFGTSGTADIVVTCQNKIPYVSTLNISSGTVPPTAGFTGAPLSGSTPLTVNFTDQSLDATTWAWDFGDTDSSTEQSPSHTYTSIGTYTVSLTVTNSYGNDTETKTSYITVVAPQPPVADFTASATAIYEGQSIDFTDISTNSPTSWAWTFAGGTPASSTEQNQSVSFAAAGTYTIALTASNAAGNDTETKTDYITVTVEPIEYCVSQGNNSTYEWIGNVTVGSLNNTSGAADYTDFTSITTNYSAGSDYAVSLTPEFSDATYQEFWKIWIDFNVDGDFDDAGEEVFSQGLSSTTVTGTLTIPSGVECLTRMRVSMKYNGEQTSTCESFSFGEVEDYTVNITDGGTVDPPVAEFTANTTTIEIGQSVNFSDLSTNSPTSWLWTFAGGTPSSS
ncbi:MAG: PKD domain-containing protein, partial [bacterium]|nr:PKD domain-containing protein [bacterium]